jgi:hypothetical protein
VRAIEALETIEATGPIERVIIWVLLQAYRRRLRAIVGTAPTWVAEEIVGLSGQTVEKEQSMGGKKQASLSLGQVIANLSR